jgi:UDP-3-O-[3-hydroxymyristoyl] N-acetylglucosamine deacetylase
MDGSAAPFVFLIECAGTVPQTAPRRAIRITKTIRVGDDVSWASLEPYDGASVECSIDFDSKVIARQTGVVSIESGAFKSEISAARTFGFLKDVDRLRAAGRALGGTLDNVVVIDGDTVMNEGGLRYDDEFVRHKLLDAIGDLYLAGGPLIGRFRASRPSHALTRRLLEAVFTDPLARTTEFAAPLSADELVPEEINWQRPARALSA